MARKNKCPKCGSLNTVRIVYGYPSEQGILAAEKGEIILGGCCVTFSEPEFHCKDCEHEWRKEVLGLD